MKAAQEQSLEEFSGSGKVQAFARSVVDPAFELPNIAEGEGIEVEGFGNLQP